MGLRRESRTMINNGSRRRAIPQSWLALNVSYALTVTIILFSTSFADAQTGESWKPYRKTKLTTRDENIRYRSSELGIDPQEFPSPKRTPALPDKKTLEEQSQPELLTPDAKEPASPKELQGKRPRGPYESVTEPSDLPAARRAPTATDLDAPFSSSTNPQTNEYIDEFDLLPQSEETLFGEPIFSGPPPLTKFKDGFFQKLNVQATNIDPAASSGFALTEVETTFTVAVPAPTKNFPLLISPIFDARFLSGPVAPDLPSQLFTTGIDFMWVPKINERLRGVIAVAPMIFSDFQSNDADMFRLTGKGIVQWDAIPDKLQFVAGVLYLNRDDVRIFPVAGAIWNPTPYWNLELIFPRPKLARLINYGTDHSDWIYLLGEFGGNSWAVRRDSGLQDKVTLRDLRLMLGIERRKNGGVNYRAEIGFVFAREIDYLSTPNSDFTPADTLLFRIGTTF